MRINRFLSTAKNNPYEGLVIITGLLVITAGKRLAKKGRPLHDFSVNFNDKVFSLMNR